MHVAGDFTYPVADAYLAPNRFGKNAAILSFVTPYGEIKWEGELEGEWLAKTIKSLRSVGFTGVDLATLKAQLAGKPVPLWIKHKPGRNGRLFLQVMISNRGGSAPRPPADQQSIAGSLRGAIAAMEEAPPQERRWTPAPFDDGDVPFDIPQ